LLDGRLPGGKLAPRFGYFNQRPGGNMIAASGGAAVYQHSALPQETVERGKRDIRQ